MRVRISSAVPQSCASFDSYSPSIKKFFEYLCVKKLFEYLCPM